MKTYLNCRAYRTGISAAHTLELPGRLVSIERGDVSSVLAYYTTVRKLEKHGRATDNNGNEYTIYASGPDIAAPGTLVIAIPGGGVNA